MTYQAPYQGHGYPPGQIPQPHQHPQQYVQPPQQQHQQQGYPPYPQSYEPAQQHSYPSMGMPALAMDGSQAPFGQASTSKAPWETQQATTSYSPQIRYETPPLPPPTPKVAYEPPVFQTFQARKKAKEMALMAQAQAEAQAQTPPQQPQRPLPSPSSSGSSRSLPMAPGAGGMRGPPHIPNLSSPLVSSPARSPLPRVQPTPPQTAPLPPPRSASPQPPPRSSSTQIPAYPSASSFTSQHSSRSASPLPQPPPRSQTLPPDPSVPTSTSDPRLRSGRPLPIPAPMQATIERSDTITSVKSLDLERTRPLPRPPGGVNTSKSLDRGISPVAGGSGRSSRPVSVVSEEMEEVGRSLGAMGLAGGSRSTSPVARSPSPATPSLPKPPVIVSSTVAASTKDPKAPAKFQPLPPTISLPDGAELSSDESEPVFRPPRSPSPGPAASFAGPPIIAVSTSDTRDETPGEISFSVPSFSFDVDEPAPLPSTSAPVIQLPSLASEPVASSSRPTQLKPSGSAILCAHCGDPIIGRIVSAMGKRWHPACFMCAECGELLEHVSSYESDGKAYCHLDYHEKHAHVCFHCKTAIVDPRFVTLDLPELGRRYYHELHFFCGECGDPFLDPSKSSAPGTKRAKQKATNDESEDEDETNNFVFHKGHPFCERCHLRLHKPKCRACKQPIPEIALSAMGAQWHKECFVCTNCSSEFKNDLFFPRGGDAFCTECYEQMLAR